MKRLLWALVPFLPVLTFATLACAEPIVIVSSYHNLDYAEEACNHILASKGLLPNDADVQNGVAECKLADDTRSLGRKLENAVMDKLAINTQCQGVSVYRQKHPKYDGKIDYSELGRVLINSEVRLVQKADIGPDIADVR